MRVFTPCFLSAGFELEKFVPSSALLRVVARKRNFFWKGAKQWRKLIDNIINHTPSFASGIGVFAHFVSCMFVSFRAGARRAVILIWRQQTTSSFRISSDNHFLEQLWRTLLCPADALSSMNRSTVKWKSFRGIEMAAQREKTGGRQTASVHRLWRWWKGLNFDHNQKRRRVEETTTSKGWAHTAQEGRAGHNTTEHKTRCESVGVPDLDPL